ncbi:MAG: glycosyltransferase family 8 protein [Schwartzia sp.]|nr:glycosyltransferase family 8 protein [Schwartzia sp. (in: firmicutes)]
MGKSKINIVFASDDHYAQHAAVAMASVLEHAKYPEQIEFFLLSDRISEMCSDKLRVTAANWKSKISIIPVNGESFTDLYVSAQLSRAAYMRLAVTEFLPESVDKIIYLDCDLLVRKDIAELWEFPMNGSAIAAVPDCGIMTSWKSRKQKHECIGLEESEQYFNSGVLVIDLSQWRAKGYSKQLLELVRENSYPHHDQDALNVFFHHRWTPLPLEWNVIPPVWFMFIKVLFSEWRSKAAAAQQNPAILHYAGGYKPWEYEIHKGFNDEYYAILKKTAFSDAKMPQFDARKKQRSIKRQMVRLKMGNIWGNLFGRK